MRAHLDPSKTALPIVVRELAGRTPDRTYLEEVDGGSLTYRETHESALRWASAYECLGVREGDRVICMRRPSIDGIAGWLGLGWLGAIETSVNTDYRGEMLRYVIENSGARVVVAAAEFVPRLVELTGEVGDDLVIVVVDSDEPTSELRERVVGRSELLDGVTADERAWKPAPWSIASVIYTSGTTGPSKGVLVPWAQIYATADGCFRSDELGPDDAFYSPFAMYHMSGKLPPFVAASCGGRLVLRETMTLTGFWEDIRKYGCTIAVFGGPMIDPLLAEPPSPTDRDLPLRFAIAGPVPPGIHVFAERFDVKVGTAFNMTEISVPIRSGWNLGDPRSCGRLREGWPGYEVRIVDEHDQEVPVDTIGELIVRTEVPWTLNAGYLGFPDKTADAWRNGWFHTGDAFTVDANGNYFFVDRFKDAIRRRGENISSFEVEVAVVQHPEVVECAAIAVGSVSTGDEIKVCVVPTDGSTLTPAALHEWLVPRMPRFMVPRYIEIVAELPKTEATLKVQKAKLREAPLNDATWDREAAGVVVPR